MFYSFKQCTLWVSVSHILKSEPACTSHKPRASYQRWQVHRGLQHGICLHAATQSYLISIYHLAAGLLPGRALRPLRLADQESAEPTLRHVRGGGGGGGGASAGAGQGHQPQVGTVLTPPALLSAVYYLPRSAILSCPFGQYSRQRAGPGRVAKPVSIPTVPPVLGQGGMEEDTGTTHTFLFELKSLSLFMYLRNS